jgi:hypothetical protein
MRLQVQGVHPVGTPWWRAKKKEEEKMFLSCRTCNWQQDDYWDKQYNPLRNLLHWEEMLLGKNLDEPFPGESGDTRRSWRDVIIEEVHRTSAKIYSMEFRTREEFLQRNPEWECPVCHENSLVED